MARLMIDVVREELDVLLDYFKPITSEELDELVVILRSALQKAEDQRRELWREQDFGHNSASIGPARRGVING